MDSGVHDLKSPFSIQIFLKLKIVMIGEKL
jgi:hypothetical protein